MGRFSNLLALVCVWFTAVAVMAQSQSKVPESEAAAEPSASAATEDLGSEFEPTKLLALVGGEPIFVGDLLFEVNQLIDRFMAGAPQRIVDRERKALIRKLLPKYIEQKMLLIDVKKGLPEQADWDEIIESSASEFDDKALQGMMEAAGVNSPALFDAHLRAQGSSLRKFRNTWTTNQVVRYFLSQEIQSSASISHQELLDYYKAHSEEFEFKAKARWEQVMVRHDRFASETDSMSAIVELGNKIVYGASLAGVAQKESHGLYAQDGGYHDWTTKGSLVLKEIDKAIFTLPVGELSDIIKTDQGFHIVRVVERVDEGKVPFLDAQVEIKKKLENKRRAAAFEAHMTELRDAIPVEIIGITKPSTQLRLGQDSNRSVK